MVAVQVLLGSAVLFLFTFKTGDALKCYECNSYNDTRCAMEVPPVELQTECSEKNEGNIKYILCRKISQTIEFEVNGLQPDSRVIRGCGWDDSTYKNRCYQRSGFGGRQEVCSCSTDLCNSASSLTATTFLALVIAVGLTKYCNLL